MAEDQVATWLKSAKAVLLAEGFKRDAKQFRKPGQAWGLIRQEPDDMQLHVRAFDDGRLETEVELSNKYVQHLWSKRDSAHEQIAAILDANGLPTERVSETFVPITGSKQGKQMPKGRTKNSTASAAGVAAIAIGVGIMVGKQYLQKVIFKRVPAARGVDMARKVLGRK